MCVFDILAASAAEADLGAGPEMAGPTVSVNVIILILYYNMSLCGELPIIARGGGSGGIERVQCGVSSPDASPLVSDCGVRDVWGLRGGCLDLGVGVSKV